MTTNSPCDVLVLVEQRDGKPAGASLQLFAPAKDLAAKTGGRVVALVIGSGVGDLSASLGELGAAATLTADEPGLATYRARPYARALAAAVDKIKPKVVLLATTFMGRDLAPRAATRARAALATDCIGMTMEGSVTRVRRTLYAGKCVADFVMDPERVHMISVRPNTFSTPARESGRKAAVEALATTDGFAAIEDRVKAAEVVRTGGTSKDVTEADVIVAGGRSLKSEENFKILEDLADAVDGAVGASRAACDAGYQPHSRQIGLTGKVVTPRLYFACGIDGAIQHLAGMRGSKVIVAINTKRDAPIFEHATYGCCVDLFTLVPLLTAELQRMRDGG